MRKAHVYVNDVLAGILEEFENGQYQFTYDKYYQGSPVSLTMPLTRSVYAFKQFPSFFEGLLPEGAMLDALLRKHKLDKRDYFGQLLTVGHDMVGAVTVEEIK